MATPAQGPDTKSGGFSIPTPWAVALVFGATLVAYFPALGAGYIWDDDAHVTKPALRSFHGLWRIWFEIGATQQYYPVLHSAFWVEHRLWGDAPLGYHLLNVLLHATAACLFGWVLQRLWVDRVVPNAPAGPSGGTSALGTTRSTWAGGPLFAALLFALHPVCVESVAWISEQKNTLSTVFYLLSALAYLNFDEIRSDFWSARKTEKGGAAGPSDATGVIPSYGPKGAAGTRRPTSVALRINSGLGSLPRRSAAETGHTLSFSYIVSLALFVLAVLSKSVTATLPAALLVVAWRQRGRISWRRDVAPLLPFFAIGLGAGLFTAWVERAYIIGAESTAFDLSLLERSLLAGRVIWFYLGKLLWPVDLIFIYPRWNVDAAVGWQYLFPVGVVAVLFGLWSIRRRTRGPLAAALFYVGTLFPALGFFNAYPFVFSYVADHFQYLASLGIITLFSAGMDKIGKRKSESGNVEPAGRSAFRFSDAFYLLILCVLGTLTYRDCLIYRDSETLYRATLARNPDSFMARNNLGKILRESGRIPEAIRQYLAVLRLKPDAEAHYNLGVALVSAGRPADAAIEFRESLLLRPDYPEAHINLALALARTGHFAEAIENDEEALRLKPDLSELRRPDEETLRTNAAEAHNGLGDIFLAQGRLPEAIEQFSASLEVLPDSAAVHANLGVALAREGRFVEAIGHFDEALRLEPGLASVQFDLGNALYQAGRIPEAMAHYREALRLKPDFSQARARLERIEAGEDTHP